MAQPLITEIVMIAVYAHHENLSEPPCPVRIFLFGVVWGNERYDMVVM
jgi:hypothetical protein